MEHCISNIVDEERLQDLLMTQPTEVKQIKRNRLVFENKEVEDVAPEKERKNNRKKDIIILITSCKTK